MRWFRHRSVALDTPPIEIEEVAYEEPERGPFDHPYRIRSTEQLAEEYAQPLDDASASRALAHMQQRREVEATAEPVEWLDGIAAAEAYNPNYQADVADHERRLMGKEIHEMLQTPFMQRMLGVQATYLRWKGNIKKFGSRAAG